MKWNDTRKPMSRKWAAEKEVWNLQSLWTLWFARRRTAQPLSVPRWSSYTSQRKYRGQKTCFVSTKFSSKLVEVLTWTREGSQNSKSGRWRATICPQAHLNKGCLTTTSITTLAIQRIIVLILRNRSLVWWMRFLTLWNRTLWQDKRKRAS